MAEVINRLAKTAPLCEGDPTPEEEERMRLEKEEEERRKNAPPPGIKWEDLEAPAFKPMPNDPYAAYRNDEGLLLKLPDSDEDYSDFEIDYDNDEKGEPGGGAGEWLTFEQTKPEGVSKEKWEIQQAVKGHRERNGMMQKLNEELTKEHAEVMEERLALEVQLEELRLQQEGKA